MSLVTNRTPQALGKALAGKKMPAGTRLGTADLKSVFFHSTSMLTFTILLDGIFYTHKIDASNDASTSFFLLFHFFSSFSDCYCSIV
jgi:hypothetical protein